MHAPVRAAPFWDRGFIEDETWKPCKGRRVAGLLEAAQKKTRMQLPGWIPAQKHCRNDGVGGPPANRFGIGEGTLPWEPGFLASSANIVAT